MAGLSPISGDLAANNVVTSSRANAKRAILAAASGVSETVNAGKNAAAVDSASRRMTATGGPPAPDGHGSTIDVTA